VSPTWPDLENASPELRALLRRIDHPRTGPRRRRELGQQALRRVRRNERPQLWAALQIEIGSDWMEDPEADPVDKIERAIQACRRALRVPEITPRVSGAALANLGFCFSFRLRGNPVQNAETAIAYDQEALKVLDPADDSELWGSTAHRLAANFLERSAEDRSRNLETARSLFQKALRVRTFEGDPLGWAATRNGLAAVYAQRLRGDRVDNQERALDGFQEVLRVFNRESFPERWAETWTNLGNIYAERLSGDPAENREKAIAAYRQALGIFTREEAPERWARTSLNLGNALHERALDDRAENVEAAIECYESVLQVFSWDERPYEWATAQDDLGTALTDRLRGDPEENRTRAIAAHRAALTVWRRGGWEWARTQNNLGALYTEPLAGVPPDRRRAARCFRAAASVSPIEIYPDRHRLAQRNLGHLWFAARRWKAAQSAYAAALQASEILFRSGATPDARNAELRENLEIPIRSAYALARQGRLHEAVEALEQGRARTLAEALARRETALEQLPAADRQAFERARERVDQMEAEARSLDPEDRQGFLRLSRKLAATRKALGGLSSAPEAVDVCSLAGRLGAPLAYLLLTQHGCLALIVPPSAPIQALWLDDFTDRLAEEIDEREGGFLASVSTGDAEGTKRALDASWLLWQERLMCPLVQRLRHLGFQRAVLIPCGRLALWPLPATVADQIHLSLVPSARVLTTALHHAEARRELPPSLLSVAQPGADRRHLPSAEIEAERATESFPRSRLLRGPEATREAVVRGLPGATHLHFACHGSFDNDKPLASALQLAGEPLTLRDLLDGDLDLGSARLAVLSACDSGRIEHRSLLDEVIGFPAGFLQAGVPAVVSTLWAVDDLAATFLLADFYDAHVRRSLPLLDALAAAQERLRTATHRELGLADHCEKILRRSPPPHLRGPLYLRQRQAEAHPEEMPFRHPFYWAPFVVSGVGWEAPSISSSGHEHATLPHSGSEASS
jgi:CHAT domain-containing protein/tetratricopeptide (TPR) repeat protein